MFVKLLEGFPGFPYSFARVSAGFLGVSVGFLRFRACVKNLLDGFGRFLKGFVRVSVGFRAVFELSGGFP